MRFTATAAIDRNEQRFVEAPKEQRPDKTGGFPFRAPDGFYWPKAAA